MMQGGRQSQKEYDLANLRSKCLYPEGRCTRRLQLNWGGSVLRKNETATWL